jgi:hypothetical protein
LIQRNIAGGDVVLKLGKLIQQVKTVQIFVADRISRNQAYIGVDQELNALDELLKINLGYL